METCRNYRPCTAYMAGTACTHSGILHKVAGTAGTWQTGHLAEQLVNHLQASRAIQVPSARHIQNGTRGRKAIVAPFSEEACERAAQECPSDAWPYNLQVPAGKPGAEGFGTFLPPFRCDAWQTFEPHSAAGTRGKASSSSSDLSTLHGSWALLACTKASGRVFFLGRLSSKRQSLQSHSP